MDKKIIVLLVIIGVLVLIIGGLAGALVYKYSSDSDTNTNQVAANSPANLNVVKNANITVTNTNAVVNTNTVANANTATTNANASLEAVVPAGLTPISDLGLADTNVISGDGAAKYYAAGTINEGEYNGADLILMTLTPDGPFLYPLYYRFARQGSKLTLLSLYSDDPADMLLTEKYSVDTKTTLSFLDFPTTLNGPEPRQTLTLDSAVNALFDATGLKVAFTDALWGTVYTTDDPALASGIFQKYGFYIEARDGTTKVYKLSVDFLANENVPIITWSDGSKNINAYTFGDVGGCGMMNYNSISNLSLSALEIIGTNSRGDIIYQLKDSNDPLLTDYYNETYSPYITEKLTYAEFLAEKAIIFWVDPFGRLIKATNNMFAPLAECGKPVIYLYPQKTTKVSVQVKPQGGMSVSEPAYNNGWNVIADQDSNLYDLGSKTTVPYLFWEGRSTSLYEQPKIGFVTARAQVNNFLIEKLSLYGLNQKEIADFIEFWSPRLQDAPYYFITFLGTREMNQLAPLTVTPKPDTIIRVLMDFRPLQQPIKTQEYTIKTPERKGFTVVEWGGVIR